MSVAITQHELDRLFTAALETAIALIGKQGEFFPVLFELRADRTIHTLAVLDRAAPDDPVAGYHAVLRPRAVDGTIIASAIAEEIAGEPRTIRIRLRAANFSNDILVPFELTSTGLLKRGRKVIPGDFTQQAAENEVFRASCAQPI